MLEISKNSFNLLRIVIMRFAIILVSFFVVCSSFAADCSFKLTAKNSRVPSFGGGIQAVTPNVSLLNEVRSILNSKGFTTETRSGDADLVLDISTYVEGGIRIRGGGRATAEGVTVISVTDKFRNYDENFSTRTGRMYMRRLNKYLPTFFTVELKELIKSEVLGCLGH